MYISGENIVVKPYTPVDAYAVMPMGDGFASGETGDGNVVVANTRFFWEYIPGDPENSGFTGAGWFCGVSNTPLAKVKEEDLIAEFENGRTDLNDIFAAWQIVVDNQGEGQDYVGDLIDLIYANGGNSSCYSLNG